jgi:short-subunit dehydrogenase
MVDIEDRIIVITGASSGIGAEAARALAARGACVCLVARRADELEQVRAAIVAAGGKAWTYAADLTQQDQLDTCAGAILKDHGRVDVLVNNAGRSIRRSVHDSFGRDHDYQRVMQINYFAAVGMTLRLLPGMLERGDGQIVNVTTMGVQFATPKFSAYIASKCALEGFSRCLSAEMADRGVAVTVVRFPLVRTAMSAPTPIYRKVPQMDAAEAAQWIVRAVEKRPAQIGRPGGKLMEVVGAVFPGPSALWTGRTLRLTDRWLQQRVARDEPGTQAPAAASGTARTRSRRARSTGNRPPPSPV